MVDTNSYKRNMEFKAGESLPPGFFRIAMGVEYDGSGYRGWQTQASMVLSIQQKLEQALSKIANEPIKVNCAGRTDAEVHATGQVIHFDTKAFRSERSWQLGTNTQLPPDIVITWVKPVVPQFHARFSALSRRYRYLIINTSYRPATAYRQLTWEPNYLDTNVMSEGLKCLIGEHDFTSFRAAGCQAHSPVRRLQQAQLWRQGQLIIVELQANGFLHHMVRNIMGVLLKVGRGQQSVQWVQEVLDAKDRTKADVTAKPNGLFLVKVEYPEAYQLPNLPIGPCFLKTNFS